MQYNWCIWRWANILAFLLSQNMGKLVKSEGQPVKDLSGRGIRGRHWQLLGTWLFLRVLTSLWAALVSTLRSLTAREQNVALWPPAAPWGAWLERVLLAPWERWDVWGYLQIVTRGYQASDGTVQFHPLFPWLAAPLARLTGNPLLGLMIVASLSGLFMLLAFWRLASLDLDSDSVNVSAWMLLSAPVSFVLFAPYPEALFLLWAVLCFLFARRKSWWLAGGAGALATLTRQQGLLLALPLAWELWESTGRDWRRAVKSWQNWLSLALIPGGMLLWVLYRAWILHDVHVDVSSFHTLVYSLLISPSANLVVPEQTFMWPWQALALALRQFGQALDYRQLIDLGLGGIFVLALILGWKQMRMSYRIYAVAVAWVSFSYYTGPKYPYMGLPRHLLLAFPVFIGLVPAIRQSWVRLLTVTISGLVFFFLVFLYVIRSWVP